MPSDNGASLATVLPIEGRAVDASIIERVIAAGDLSRLSPPDRVAYYMAVCRSIGLNPLTKPFDYIQLNGKLTLYATKNCTDQLRQEHGVSVVGMTRDTFDGLHVVAARVRTQSGREDEDIGAVSVKGLSGEALANALMKATTKAKRRATLSICGLSFVDESEIETIPDARRVTVDQDGVVVEGRGVTRPQLAVDGAAMLRTIYERIDAAVSVAEVNNVARYAKRASDDGTLSEEHLEAVKAGVAKKRKVLAEQAGRAKDEPPPSEPPAPQLEEDAP